MAGNIRLEIVTPEKGVVDEDAEIVMAPGSLGEFGVLIHHTPFMTTLKTGTIRFKDAEGRERFVFVSGGFAEALPDRVTVLAESAERRRDIDLDRARTALERAQKRLADDEDTARVLGVDVAAYKLAAFALGTAMAGLAGGLYTYFARFIVPDDFGFITSITVLSMVAVGGIGSVSGVVAATVILTLMPEFFRFISDYKLFVYGALLFAVMRFAPGGLAGCVQTMLQVRKSREGTK